MSPIIECGNVRIRLSDRRHNLALPEGRSALLTEHGFPGDRLCWAKQIHGARVAVVDAPGQIPDCDGLVSVMPDLPLLMRFADCFPVVVADPRGAVAVLHAGWRGTVAGVVKAGIARLQEMGFRPVHAWIGAGIQRCCFEVGDEVAAEFPAIFVEAGPKPKVDLARHLTAQLYKAGAEYVYPSPDCTACRRDRYFSYRKEGPETGRHGALAWIQA